MTFKVVKTTKAIANLADTWFKLRADRLAKDKEAAALKKDENAAKEALIKSLLAQKATGIGGSTVNVSLKTKKKPIVNDWPVLHAYIRETGEFDLLQKRIGEGAVAERWEEGIEIPGVVSFDVDDISYSAVKD